MTTLTTNMLKYSDAHAEVFRLAAFMDLLMVSAAHDARDENVHTQGGMLRIGLGVALSAPQSLTEDQFRDYVALLERFALMAGAFVGEHLSGVNDLVSSDVIWKDYTPCDEARALLGHFLCGINLSDERKAWIRDKTLRTASVS